MFLGELELLLRMGSRNLEHNTPVMDKVAQEEGGGQPRCVVPSSRVSRNLARYAGKMRRREAHEGTVRANGARGEELGAGEANALQANEAAGADNTRLEAVVQHDTWERDHAMHISRGQGEPVVEAYRVHEEKREEVVGTRIILQDDGEKREEDDGTLWTPEPNLMALEGGALWTDTVHVGVPACRDIFSPNSDVTVPWSSQMTHASQQPETGGRVSKTTVRADVGNIAPSSRARALLQQVLNFSSSTPPLTHIEAREKQGHCCVDSSGVDVSCHEEGDAEEGDYDAAKSTDDATAHEGVLPANSRSSSRRTRTECVEKTSRGEGLIAVKTRSSGSTRSSKSRFLTRSARRNMTTPRLLFSVGPLWPKGDDLKPIPEDVIVHHDVYRKRPDEVGYSCTGMKKRAPASVDVGTHATPQFDIVKWEPDNTAVPASCIIKRLTTKYQQQTAVAKRITTRQTLVETCG
eukprot:GEMP01021306.1.p1 GENE.GEMP01021306.1~~GEMP01021306.1.p1  ORF type:complete len:464 (+),score=114.55 GEMP01021306.1:210-1601(+)